jgi:hypothetical protein
MLRSGELFINNRKVLNKNKAAEQKQSPEQKQSRIDKPLNKNSRSLERLFLFYLFRENKHKLNFI